MAKISQREKVLLGYSPDSFTNLSSKRSSDLDFSDVFGGPPKRTSIQEFDHHERSNSFDSYDDNDEDDGGISGPRNSWTGLGEKPVFGEEVGPTRRRFLSQNFFDDIFQGDHSPSNNSRNDPFSSAPGSRVMSPTRPLTPMVEPFATPPRFSLATRSTNANFMASTPTVNQNQTTQIHDVNLRADVRLSYRPSPLSHRNLNKDGKPKTGNKMKDESVDNGYGFKKDSDVIFDSTQFHFSMYKWAAKGVPLSNMSLRKMSHSQSKDGIIQNERRFSENKRVELEDDVLESHIISVSVTERLSASPSRNDEQREDCNDNISKFRPQNFENQARENAADGNTSKVPSPTPTSEKKSEIADSRKQESAVKEEVVSSSKVNKSNKVSSQSFRGKKDDHNLKGGGIGKVKEFVNIFNKESFSRAKKINNDIGKSKSCRMNDTTSFGANDYDVKSTPNENHDEIKASKVNNSKTMQEPAGKKVEGEHFPSGKHKSRVDNIGGVSHNPNPASIKEPAVDASRDSAPDITFGELPQEINMQLEVEYQEEIKDYENKIRQWSKGKEGNIRALLSTLQYVLWAESGWKAVPLVDIIEANAVKRAYQKALLRLHPDKLQQKGAADCQKFIAQRVFEILQEAWDQFSSLGNL